ncbi:hypothetical protein PYK79_11140 [Streptomyces sp. ID05-04B]|uniref:hypothetical protein n=1 Tax=unclassified Streptomyces TaxID=2593676 RepID=UPI000D1ABD20|nr:MULTISPECIES: hypothetical protein [unclassified Streptomyces]AVV46480.1 hypothetical protein C6376_39090 [Streptomyces sp. P3]AVV46841.1 hypothetical protein C6376_41495 [Streptomyces sp. P3]MDX5563808.1 hypothetical protein [Streptomyces sp. ID05-04B]
MRRPLLWQGIRVPWITPWSGEVRPMAEVEIRHGRGGVGLGYADEVDTDRRFDALWVRRAATPGVGRPDLRSMHPLRQRQAMTHMLCQVCGTAVDGGEQSLFLMHSRPGDAIREGEVTAVPPAHDACARRAVRECPHLRRGWVAALVRRAPLWGVAGVAYDPRTLTPLPGPGAGGSGLHQVPYADATALRWLLAARLLVSLQGVEPVDVDGFADQPAAAGR